MTQDKAADFPPCRGKTPILSSRQNMSRGKRRSQAAMRRSTTGLVVTLLIATLATGPATAAKNNKRDRTAVASYTGGMFVSCDLSLGCVEFDIEPGERFVKVDIKDMSGQAVFAEVWTQERFQTGLEDHQHICGSTDQPLELAPDLKVLRVLVEFPFGPAFGCPGVAFGGKVVVKFSRN